MVTPEMLALLDTLGANTVDRLDDRRRLLRPPPGTPGTLGQGLGAVVVAAQRVGTWTRALDGVELADERQDLGAGRRIVRLRLDELVRRPVTTINSWRNA